MFSSEVKLRRGFGVIKPQLSTIELTASEKETRMRCQKGVEMEEIGREWSRRQKKCCAFGRQ